MMVVSGFSFSYSVFVTYFFRAIKSGVHPSSGIKFPDFSLTKILFSLTLFPLLNPFPNDKILECSKFKAHADDKINVTPKFNFLEIVENTVGKGENAGFQHVLLFPQCFQ